jgi:hypothetical protein
MNSGRVFDPWNSIGRGRSKCRFNKFAWNPASAPRNPISLLTWQQCLTTDGARPHRSVCFEPGQHSFHWTFTCSVSEIRTQTMYRIRVGSISVMTELRVGRPGFHSSYGLESFPPHHRVQAGSGAHPIPHPMVTGVYFPRGKADCRWSYNFTPPYVFMAWSLPVWTH